MNTYHDDLATDRSSSHTCGMLGQAPTPFPHTIRPPSMPVAEVVQLPTLSLPMPVAPPTRVMHGVVASLLKLGRANDLSQDQAYMPLEGCTLKEAVRHLRRKRHLLIQGGCLYYGGGSLHVKMWGRRDFPHITVQEALHLLKANYPLPDGAVRRHPDDYASDRPTLQVPVVQSKPMPLAGVGFFSVVPYGGDIDDIGEQEWQPIRFPRSLAHELIFIGDTHIDGATHYVWWSVPIACYIAQQVPSTDIGDDNGTW
jgi:hypothetical protein